MRHVYLLLLILWLPQGCATSENAGEKAEPPTIVFENFAVLSTGLFIKEFVTDFSVSNPNNDQVSLTALTFNLDIDGLPFVRGSTYRPVTVPRLGTVAVPIVVTANTLGLIRDRLFRDLLALGNEDKIVYRLYGTAKIRSNGQTIEIPVGRNGSLSPVPARSRSGQEAREVRRFAPNSK